MGGSVHRTRPPTSARSAEQTGRPTPGSHHSQVLGLSVCNQNFLHDVFRNPITSSYMHKPPHCIRDNSLEDFDPEILRCCSSLHSSICCLPASTLEHVRMRKYTMVTFELRDPRINVSGFPVEPCQGLPRLEIVQTWVLVLDLSASSAVYLMSKVCMVLGSILERNTLTVATFHTYIGSWRYSQYHTYSVSSGRAYRSRV